MPLMILTSLLKLNRLSQQINLQLVVKQVIHRRFIRQIFQGNWAVGQSPVRIEPQQIQLRWKSRPGWTPLWKSSPQVEVQVINRTRDAESHCCCASFPCPANFQATGFVPVLLIAQSVENWMNKPLRSVVSFTSWASVVGVDEGNRFIQRLVNPTQVFPKQSVKDGILIRGMTFTKPPEPVGTLCRIQGFPRFRLFLLLLLDDSQNSLASANKSQARFLAGSQSRCCHPPKTTVQLISARVCSGWERVEKF